MFVQTQHNLEETDWVLGLCAEHDFLAGVVGWVDLASAVQVSAKTPIGPTDRANVLGNGRYGFNWWVRGGVGDMPDTPPGTFYMSGLHNNMCFVVPEWDMIIVRRGEDGNPPAGKRFAYNAFFRALGAANGI